MPTSLPKRMLRLTAKSTLFGRRNFSSWLAEASGSVPIKRRKDFVDSAEVDNSDSMDKLMEALEMGDAVCLFPQGISIYHPTVAPLKTGAARIISDVLTRNRDNPEFEVWLQTCSITYLHRQYFRSDVLVTFHKPRRFTPGDNPELLAPVEYTHIRTLTNEMQEVIASGTIDSPSWSLIRTAKAATRIYAPLGTSMGLGEYVRLVSAFVNFFKSNSEDEELTRLREDLDAYQSQLSKWKINDDRIRRPLSRRTLISRALIRFTWTTILFVISLPGLILWTPVFLATTYAVKRLKKSGPMHDTWDEISMYKQVYGLITTLFVWVFTSNVLIWGRGMGLSVVLVIPAIMWITLRWLEDAVAAFRSFSSLRRLFMVGKPALKACRTTREGLHARVSSLATKRMKLPEDPEAHYTGLGGGEKGRVRGGWESGAGYFSLRRRRKKDWSEVMRLYEVDYPADEQ